MFNRSLGARWALTSSLHGSVILIVVFMMHVSLMHVSMMHVSMMHVSMMHVSMTLDPDTCMYDAYIYPDTRD